MATEKITPRDIYKTAWKCRDFEISTLWQRSAMLGVFMVAMYAGYGTLLLSAFEHGCLQRWTSFNLLAEGMCCFGMVFSALWIMMLKGSKGWYERCEAALSGFRAEKQNGVFVDDDVREDAAFGIFWSSATERELKKSKLDENLFSTVGGHFSVSRVAIALGQVSFAGWLVLAFAHAVALMFDGTDILWLVKAYAPVLAVLLLIGFVWGVFGCLKDRVQSTSLRDADDNFTNTDKRS